MYTDFNSRLREVKEKCSKKKKWEDHLVRAESYLVQEEEKARRLLSRLKKEKQDVERLESLSLVNLFYTLTGKKIEKLDKEKQEVIAATLKFNEAEQTIKDLKEEINEYKVLLETVQGCEEEYLWILDEKERLVYDKDSFWSEELYELTEKEAHIELTLKEHEEAIQAGQFAQKGLFNAVKSLESAKGWSTFDMFGGGMISTAIKHSHIDEAKDSIHRVQHDLRMFQEELLDIKEQFHVQLEIGNFLTFADYFFDGLIVDWAVHGKISDSLNQVEEVLQQVNDLILTLKVNFKELQQEHRNLIDQRREMIEAI